MKRLTWLVGPPGAGKSTMAASQKDFTRVVELTRMLGPLVDTLRLRKGVLGANGHLVRAIRSVELQAEYEELPPLLVVAGLVPEEALFPLSDREEVLLLLPERDRWERQLCARPPREARLVSTMICSTLVSGTQGSRDGWKSLCLSVASSSRSIRNSSGR